MAKLARTYNTYKEAYFPVYFRCKITGVFNKVTIFIMN